MKLRIFAALIAIIPVLVVATDMITIGTGDVAAAAGSTNVSVPVYLSNNDSVAVMQFNVAYPDYLAFRGAQNTTRMFNATIEANALGPTELMVAAFVPNNISAGTGAIMNLVFDVNSSAVPGNYSINMSDVILTNVEINELPASPSSSLFTIL